MAPPRPPANLQQLLQSQRVDHCPQHWCGPLSSYAFLGPEGSSFVHVYKCLSTLQSNMKKVLLDKQWVVEIHLLMKKTRAWCDLESEDYLHILELEQELQAKTPGVSQAALPPSLHKEPFRKELDDNLLT
jgi:hypothetical protein